MANSKYNYKVKTGNWNDELYLEEEKLRQFMLKRERGELFIQKKQQLINNLYKEVILDIAQDKQIRFGNVVQLISPDNCKAGKLVDIALSGVVGPSEIDRVQHLSEGCEMTGSTETKPCVRNCFIICSEKYDRCGEVLKYGQAFSMSPVESDNGPLYIEAEVPTFYSTFGFSQHPVLQFTGCKNFYSLWRILPLDHRKRRQLDGTPVTIKPEAEAVILSILSNEACIIDQFVLALAFSNVVVIIPLHLVELNLDDSFRISTRTSIFDVFTTRRSRNEIDQFYRCIKNEVDNMLKRIPLTNFERY